MLSVQSYMNTICSACLEDVLRMKYMDMKCFAYFDEDDIRREKIANVKYEFYEGHVCSDNSTFHLVMDECRGRE